MESERISGTRVCKGREEERIFCMQTEEHVGHKSEETEKHTQGTRTSFDVSDCSSDQSVRELKIR